MVDSIGAKPSVAGDRSVARVAAATPATVVQTPVLPKQTSVVPDSIALAKIKKAIASGTFPILPATIADRLLALKLSWNSNEAS
jgi:negative regulator of flagellin synthesis FlgM